jgi:RNA polymerase sigma-70 factor, ECF subfamily
LTNSEAVDRFTALYEDCYRRVYAYAVSRAGRQLADEVVSEVFLIAWRRLAEVPDDALPWLLAVARNVAIGQFRLAARQQSIAAELRAWTSADTAVTGDVADQVSERLGVLRALATLSEADREVLTLAVWHDLSSRAAAQVVGCSTATYFVRLHRAAQGWWQPGDGHVGSLGNSDETLAQFQALPSRQAKVRATMRRAALEQNGHVTGAALAEDMFGIGVQLLGDPVTPQVRAAVYRVIASLPGVRLTGITADPLGRPGYGVGFSLGGGQDEVIVVSPSTGALLSQEFVVTTAGRVRTKTDWSSCRERDGAFDLTTASPRERALIRKSMPSAALCARLARDGTRYVQYGVQYHGQVVSYDAYTQGWTNASPGLPRAQFGPADSKG